MMIGATPATLTNSGCTTPSEMPAATPASIALPPASRILKPASAARYWVAAIMWCVPMMVGRWDFMLAPLCQGLVSLDGMKSQLGRHQARDQPLGPPGRSAVPHRARCDSIRAGDCDDGSRTPFISFRHEVHAALSRSAP